MSEDGCLRDAVFNTMQVESGDLEDSFPGGLGILRGLTIANGHDVSMGDNRVEDLALPTQETDAASKYYVDSILSRMDVGQVWGIGQRGCKLLKYYGVRTAFSLKKSNMKWIERHLTVKGLLTVKELNGERCIEVQDKPVQRKSIRVSRSFLTEIYYHHLKIEVPNFAL